MKILEMNMRNFLKLCIAVPAMAAGIISCDYESDIYYNSYLTAVEAEEGMPYKCFFVSDDSLRVIPLNYFSEIGELETDDRLMATFSIPGGEITDPVEVEFTSIIQMITQNIHQTSSMDTMYNDPIDPVQMWQSGGVYGVSRFLTVSFSYQASQSGISHNICLVDDLNAPNPDSDGYYHLKFRHSANKDQYQYMASSVATFLLPEKYTAPGIKGIKVDFNVITQEKDSTLTVTF